jgi:aminoglycoside phosphotransferase (APT) family kinase protein
MQLLGRGRTAEVYLTDDGKALKLFFPEFQGRVPQSEARVALIVSEQCPAAPTFYGTMTVDNRIGLLYERIEGEAVTATSISSGFNVNDFARQFARLHREIHTVSGNGLGSVQDALEQKIQAFDGVSDACRSLLLSQLREDGKQRLCHGDFHPENVILGPDGQLRPIDWANAHQGHPLADVARTVYLIGHGLGPGMTTISDEERVLRDHVIHSYTNEYFGEAPPDEIQWASWQIIVMISRYTEGIEEEKPAIEQAITEIQTNHPALR